MANLLAKKLIDKFGQNSVYGYTFNAVATINGNMIPDGSKLPNLQYAPIMNIYNDDEMMVMFTSEETNMYKYGTNVHMSLSENLTSKVKAAFKQVHGSNYDKNMKSKVVDLINRIFNINLRGYSAFVFGMTGTEQSLTEEEMNNAFISNEYYAGKIHLAFSMDELKQISAIWHKLYDRSLNKSGWETTHIVSEILFEYYDNKIAEIENMQKKLGRDGMKQNIDSMAFNNAQNNSNNQRIETATNFDNNIYRNSKDDGKTIIDVLADLSIFYINTINTHEKELQADRANNLANGENGAIKYYDDKAGSGDIKEYKYLALKNLVDIREDKYLVTNSAIFGDNDNYDFNARPFNTGDSCSDFAITAIRMLSNGYRGEPTDSYDKRANEKVLNDYGLRLHGTFALIMQGVVEGEEKDRDGAVGSLSFERAMNRLGWEKIYVTENMTITDLKVGDLLVSKKHVEFYTGTGYSSEYYDTISSDDRDDWKDSGIKSIHQIYGAVKKLVAGGKATGTFGWGGVHDEFPIESADGKKAYIFKKNNEAFYRICWCGIENPTITHDSGCLYDDALRRYGIIWRKK